jgi:hypothetical protein
MELTEPFQSLQLPHIDNCADTVCEEGYLAGLSIVIDAEYHVYVKQNKQNGLYHLPVCMQLEILLESSLWFSNYYEIKKPLIKLSDVQFLRPLSIHPKKRKELHICFRKTQNQKGENTFQIHLITKRILPNNKVIGKRINSKCTIVFGNESETQVLKTNNLHCRFYKLPIYKFYEHFFPYLGSVFQTFQEQLGLCNQSKVLTGNYLMAYPPGEFIRGYDGNFLFNPLLVHSCIKHAFILSKGSLSPLNTILQIREIIFSNDVNTHKKSQIIAKTESEELCVSSYTSEGHKIVELKGIEFLDMQFVKRKTELSETLHKLLLKLASTNAN